jgi:hypothetical protein
MKKLIFIIGFLFFANLWPVNVFAINNLTINNAIFKEIVSSMPNSDGYLSFKVMVGSSDLLVYYRSSCKFTGLPNGMTPVADWQAGDQLWLSADVVGYEGGVMALRASEIKYISKDVSVIQQEQTVENLDLTNPENHKLVLSSKDGNNYIVSVVQRFGQNEVPRISNGTYDLFLPGTTVSVTIIKRKINSVYQKQIVAIKRLDRSMNSARRILDIVSAGTNGSYQLNLNLTNPLILVKKNQLAVQNSGGGLLYLKNTIDAKKIFNLPNNDSYFLLKRDKTIMLKVKDSAVLNETIALEFYIGTAVNGHLVSPQLSLTVNVVVQY